MDREEPIITVNGETLTKAQAAVVRVAVTDLFHAMNDPERRKELGPIATGYELRSREVLRLMFHGKIT